MEHSRSFAPQKSKSKVVSQAKSVSSGKASLCSTWSTTALSTRPKSPNVAVTSRAQSPFRKEETKAVPSFEDTLERMKIYETKNHLNFEKTRQFLEQELALELLSAPPNPRSHQLAAGVPPIEQRYESILETRQKRMETLIQETAESRELEELKEMSGTPQILKNTRKAISPDRFYEYTEDWAKTVAKKTEDMKKTMEEKERKLTTFEPKINERKSTERVRSPIYERAGLCIVTREAKVKALARSLTPSFTPKTNHQKPSWNGLKPGKRSEIQGREKGEDRLFQEESLEPFSPSFLTSTSPLDLSE